jgi:putative transposase
MRAPSGCSKDNAALTKAVRPIHAVSREIYCALRVHAEFVAEGIPARWNRVACVKREASIVGVSRRKVVMKTVRDSKHQATDLVDRAFTADAPNVPWVADITYIPTWRVVLYLAVVLDVFSRRMAGWSMSTTLHVKVVLEALSMALGPSALAGAHCARP